MFAQIFILIMGVFSLVFSFHDSNYLWMLAGFIMVISSLSLVYKLFTGKAY